jgi:hypothetical protein
VFPVAPATLRVLANAVVTPITAQSDGGQQTVSANAQT